MPEYTFTGPSGWCYGGGQLSAGETVDVPESIARSFPQFFEGVSDADVVAPDNPATETTTDEVAAPVDPDEYTVADFEDKVESGDYSDAELDALAESEGPEDEGGRSGVHDAIAEARNGN